MTTKRRSYGDIYDSLRIQTKQAKLEPQPKPAQPANSIIEVTNAASSPSSLLVEPPSQELMFHFEPDVEETTTDKMDANDEQIAELAAQVDLTLTIGFYGHRKIPAMPVDSAIVFDSLNHLISPGKF